MSNFDGWDWWGTCSEVESDVTSATFECGTLSTYDWCVENCTHENLTVEDKEGRKIEFPIKPPLLHQDKLYVVAGWDKNVDKIKCKTTASGTCDAHNNRVFDIIPTPPLELSGDSFDGGQKTNDSADFDAKSIKSNILENPLLFFWPTVAKSRHYQINLSSCAGQSYTATVVAIPDIQWDVSVKASFDSSVFWQHTQTDRALKVNDVKGNRAFGLEIPKFSWTADGTKHELSANFQKSLDQVLSGLNWAADKLEYILPLLTDLTGTKVDLKSEVTISGSWGWEEIAGSPLAGMKGQVTVDFNPLMEIKIDQDVTDAILRLLLATPAAPIAAKIIELRIMAKKAERNFNQGKDDESKWFSAKGYVNGGIHLKVSGAIGFKIDWTKGAADPEWNGAEAEGMLSIGFGVSADLSGKWKSKFFALETSAGAAIEIGGDSKITAEKIKPVSKNQNLYVGCLLKFSGIELYGAAVFDGSIRWSKKEEGDGGYDDSFEGTYSQSSSEGDTKTTYTGSGGVSADGASGKIGASQTDSAKNSQGDSYTQSSKSGSVSGSASKSHAAGKAEGKVTYMLMEPKTWNFTDEVDSSTKALPKGPFLVLQNKPGNKK